VTGRAAPRVTVCVPCHDYGRFLGEALDSLCAQTCDDWEAIVIDDASCDDTAAVMGRYTDPRLRLVHHAENLGHIATFNEAIGEARGEFFVILSADDRYRPTFLERALDAFGAVPATTLVYTDAAIIDEHGRGCGAAATTLDPDHDWVRDVSWELMLCPFVPGGAAIARTGALRELGGYDPALPHTADTYLWRRLAFRGPVTHLTGRLFEYRDHSTGMHTGVSWPELMTTEEPWQYAALLRDPALPERVRARRSRLEAVLATHRARAAYAERHWRPVVAGLVAAVRHDPRVWEREHPLHSLVVDHASARTQRRHRD